MMQSSKRENAILATVSRLRRLLRNADLATKLVKVIGVRIFYTAEVCGLLATRTPVAGRKCGGLCEFAQFQQSRNVHLRTPHERGLAAAFRMDTKANKVLPASTRSSTI